MPISAKYLLSIGMDVNPDKEVLFTEVYNTEHVPALAAVPGVLSVARFQSQPLTMSIGGENRTFEVGDAPHFSALYELESPEVLTSAAWTEAVERGRWPGVRPYTSNSRRVLMERIYPK